MKIQVIAFLLMTVLAVAIDANAQDIDSLQAIDSVEITSSKNDWNVVRMRDTEGTAIYAGKKNEVILLDKINANTATNNTRQIYAKVPGVNIIENDAAGIQLGIATRGLNPNRTTEFNSRQNGYDISADPIGYPETYYTPPTDALQRIEIVRGAASLQYGTQFGGLLNFKFHEGNKDKPFELLSKQTGGSYGFFNTFNSIGGQYKKLNYYWYYNYKHGDGWRSNSGYDIHNGYAALKYDVSTRLKIGIQYTFMTYDMQQPAGLTDTMFARNARASYRDRNWFAATWNIPALTIDYKLNDATALNLRSYALLGSRSNVGILNRIINPDTLGVRNVMHDEYRNLYTEARLMHHYYLGSVRNSLLIGARVYKGNTNRLQGDGTAGSDADYSLTDRNNLDLDFTFPSYNIALFAEQVFHITERLSATPGVRLEYIQTTAKGYAMPLSNKIYSTEKHSRSFPLLGLGIGYQVSRETDAYFNISQNYSPVNFSDIMVSQPNIKVDSNLRDVKGYNMDIGYRGAIGTLLNFDMSAFYMAYQNRIGSTIIEDADFNLYQYKTNIADSRSLGIEMFAELNLRQLFTKNTNYKLAVFGSLAYTNAKYVRAAQAINNGKYVEFSPEWIGRAGLDMGWKHIAATLQFSHTGQQYADATNATFSDDGVVGVIPSFSLIDFSVNYKWKRFILAASVNNMLDKRYFTRRTASYPGPGIIPSDGRAFYVTIGVRL